MQRLEKNAINNNKSKRNLQKEITELKVALSQAEETKNDDDSKDILESLNTQKFIQV